MFVDVRDFTPFAESNTAPKTRCRASTRCSRSWCRLSGTPVVTSISSSVTALWPSSALRNLADHADAAVAAAVLIHRLVAERFGRELRIGVGINTGVVIAGTIGGGGKLEFTLIGDTVNVAARVEQLTKTTGDAILLTQQCVDALASRPPELMDRGFHVLKGKSTSVQVFGLDQEIDARVDTTS